MAVSFGRRSSSQPGRATPSSLRSLSPASPGWSEAISAYSVPGAARSIDYGGKKRVWTAEMDGRVVVRTAPHGEVMFEVDVRKLAFCTVLRRVSAKRIWAAFSDGFIRCYDSTTGAMESEFIQHDGAVRALASSSVNDHVYSGGDDWKIYQWSKSNCTYIRLLSGHANGVQCLLVVSPTATTKPSSSVDVTADKNDDDDDDDDDTVEHSILSTDWVSNDQVLEHEYVLSGSDDTTIKVWDPKAPWQIEKNVACLTTLRGHSGSVRAMEIYPRSGYLWSGGDDCTVRVWNWRSAEGHRCVAVLRGQHSAPITSIAYVAPRMWSSGKDGFVIVWNPREARPLQRIQISPSAAGRSILSMRRLYRATHWTVWLSGPEGVIHSLQISEEERDVDAKLDKYESLRALEKNKLVKLQEKSSAQQQLVSRLKERNKALEEQLRNQQRGLEGKNAFLLENRPASRAPRCKSVESRKNMDKKTSRATVDELRAQVNRQARTLMLKAQATKQKDEIIQALKKQLSEKDLELHKMEEKLKKLMTRQSSPQEANKKDTGKQEHALELQKARDIATQIQSDFDAYKEEMKQVQAAEKAERDKLKRQLMAGDKDEALRLANEKIEELQRDLEKEQKYANNLLEDLAPVPQKPTTPFSKRSTSRSPSPAQTPSRPTKSHYYKRLSGVYWPDVSQTYSQDLRETIWAEYTDMIGKSDVVIKDITYATARDCLLIDATLEHTKIDRDELQSLIDAHAFPRVLTLHGILSSSFPEHSSDTDNISSPNHHTLIAAKNKAETERDDVQRKLQEALEELETIRQDLENRQSIASETPRSKQNSRSSSHVMLGNRTQFPPQELALDELDALIAAKKKAETERDDVQRKLQEALEELKTIRQDLENGQRQAEARRAQIPVLQQASTGAGSASSRARLAPTRNQEPPLYAVTAEEYETLAAMKQAAEAERDGARRRLQEALEELETIRQDLENRQSIALETPRSKQNSRSSSHVMLGSRTQFPPQELALDELDALIAAKKKAETERDDVQRKLQEALEELKTIRQDLENGQRQAEARRAQIPVLQQASTGAGSASSRARLAPTRNEEPPLYAVTAEEYETLAAMKQAAEAERDGARRRLQEALEELETIRQDLENRQSIALETPRSKQNSRSSSHVMLGSRTQFPPHELALDELDALIAAKKKAETERDDVQRKLQEALEELETIRQDLENGQRQAEARRAQIPVLQQASTGAGSASSRARLAPTRNEEPPLYAVTAEEYETLAAMKQAAEAERDGARRRLQEALEELETIRQDLENRQSIALETPRSKQNSRSSSHVMLGSRTQFPPHELALDELDALIAAKKKAETERDDVQRKLQEALEELKTIRQDLENGQRQAEARRAQIPVLQQASTGAGSASSRARLAPTRNEEPPLYAVTAEEYETLAAMKQAAEAERDGARRRLQEALEELETIRQDLENRQSIALETPRSKQNSRSSSHVMLGNRTQFPPQELALDELDALIAAKKKAETERDDVQRKLQEALEELKTIRQDLENGQRQAEARRAQIPVLQQASTGAGSASSRARLAPTRNEEPPLYAVTAEEYETLAAMKQAAEAERDGARRRLQEALEELETIRQDLENRQSIALETPRSKQNSRSSSHVMLGSRTQFPPQELALDELDALIAAKKKAETERDDVQRKLQEALEELKTIRQDLENGQRQAEARRAQIPVLQQASTGAGSASSRARLAPTRNQEPPLYAVTAEEYETLAAMKQAAEAERDGARRRLQEALEELETIRQDLENRQSIALETPRSKQNSRSSSHVMLGSRTQFPSQTLAADVSGRFSAPKALFSEHSGSVVQGTAAAHSNRREPAGGKWCWYSYNLGPNWMPYMANHREVMKDVFLLELCRAVSVPLDCIRSVEFVGGGSTAEFEMYHSSDAGKVRDCLRRYPFRSLSALMRLAFAANNNSPSFPVSGGNAASSGHPPRPNESAHPQAAVRPSVPHRALADRRRSQEWTGGEVSSKELELFRSRRAISASMRAGERMLQPSLDLPRDINPNASVDVLQLQREPVYCVTIDEYRALLQQFLSVYYAEPNNNNVDDDDDDNRTRLWNEHVVARTLEERRYTRQLSQLNPQYPLNDYGKK